jgi:DNA polymerase-4
MSLSASCVKTDAKFTGARRDEGQPAVAIRCRIRPAGRRTMLAEVLAHLDLDAFYAAVELHRHPELRGQPLVVGGDPQGRGVVATASYEARRYGIRSAMSSAEAVRRCPQVVIVRPDHTEYRRWSVRVWDLVRDLAPVVEQIGIDEGYLVLPEGEPRAEAERIQLAIRREVRLSSSLGVASCKVVAKIASDMRKPGGITHVAAGDEAAFLAPLEIRRLPGVGPKSEARLAAAGIATIGQLAELQDDALARLIPGRVGDELRDRARGIDRREVTGQPGDAVSMSTEETFEHDIADRAELHRRVRSMADEVAASLLGKGLAARTVTAKVRYPDFSIATRSQSAAVGTDDAALIGELACDLLDRALASRPGPLRLVGVGVSGLERHRQLSLLGETVPAQAAGSKPRS